MGRETTLNTAENTGTGWSKNITAFTDAVGDGFSWLKDKVTSVKNSFNTNANDTKSVEPDAVVDPMLFALNPAQAVATAYAVPDRPQAIKIDPRIQQLSDTLTKQNPNEYQYDPKVEMAQQTMERLGFGDHMKDHGGSDGLFGPATESAVKAYQESIGLKGDEIDGVLTDNLFTRMQQDLLNDGLELVTEKDLSSYESPVEALASGAKSMLKTAYDAVYDAITPDTDLTAQQQQVLASMQAPLEHMHITSKFGMRPHPVHKDSDGNPKMKMHKGIDLRTKDADNPDNHQKPVYAAQDGTVIAAKDDITGYGKNIIIDHGNGVHTRYAHLSEFVKENGAPLKVGDTITKGDMIANSGDTGTGTAAHLDFSIKVNGTHVDPANILANNSNEREYTPTSPASFAPTLT